ncbi:MAG: hypothetical protein AAB790_02990 [Patescibacteria group bacterium]
MKGLAWLVIAVVVIAYGILPLFGVNVPTPKWFGGTGSLFAAQSGDAVCGLPALERNGVNWRFRGLRYDAAMLGQRPTPVERLCIVNGKAYWESHKP